MEDFLTKLKMRTKIILERLKANEINLEAKLIKSAWVIRPGF